MKAKQVWSIILIVLGVLAVITGFQAIGEADQINRYFGGDVANLRMAGMGELEKQFNQALDEAKTYGLISVFIGICMAVGGTFMLRESKPKSTWHSENHGKSAIRRNDDEDDCRIS
jgi:hypothetical protein